MLLVGSLVFAIVLFILGFYVGNQIGQTAHIRAHLADTRFERQTIHSQRVKTTS